MAGRIALLTGLVVVSIAPALTPRVMGRFSAVQPPRSARVDGRSTRLGWDAGIEPGMTIRCFAA
jgi:hypothetical protein